MTDIDTAALRAAAEAATPGPWDAEGDQVAQAFDDGMAVGGIVHASWEQQGHHDVAYIAAANPAVVLELLDRLEFLTSELGIAERASQRNANAHMAAIQRAHLAEGAVEEVRRAFDPGELDCGRIGMTCRDIYAPDRWCRACRIANALDPSEQP